MRPERSYTIWFSQRTGSTLLARSLAATGIAGTPEEWLWCENDLHVHFGQPDPARLQAHLWSVGSSPNRVFGLKYSFSQPHFSQVLATLRRFPTVPPTDASHASIWEHAFPNHRHIFLTRRNKVRLAVSWWQAIQSQVWHRAPGADTESTLPDDAYSYDAIDHLLCEATMREAGIQEFLAAGGIVPLTIVYEDFVREYAATLRRVLDFLGLDSDRAAIAPPALAPTADAVTEQWVQRFRAERQQGWQNRGW